MAERLECISADARLPKRVVVPPGKSVPVLRDGSHHYSNARLTASTNDSATITHDTGVARIPLVELDVPAIVSLNATSTTTQVGTAAFFEQRAVLAQSGSISNRINAVGMRVLVFIADRTGLRPDVLSIWLLFVIFPVLMLALMVTSVAQARKSKGAVSRKTR